MEIFKDFHYMQSFTLNLLRPKINLTTDSESKNDKAQDELNFGICHIEVDRNLMLYLNNETKVTGQWSLKYIKRIKKPIISNYTATEREVEDI